MGVRRLQINGTSSDIPQLNRWAGDIGSDLEQVRSIATLANTTAATVTSTVFDSTEVAPVVTSPQISEQGVTVDGNLYSEIVATYTSPNPLGNFAGVFLGIKGYLGSTNIVKISEDNFAGVAGASHSFKVKLERTNETVTFYFISKNGLNATDSDWSTSPNVTGIVLDGNATAPTSPTGVTATSADLGVFVNWNSNAETNIQGYKIYRYTSNTFGSSTVIYTLGAGQQNGGSYSYYDKDAGSYGTTYYYWITAVNSANQESSASTVASAVYEGILNSVMLGPVNAVGSITTLTSVVTQSGTSTTINVSSSTWDFNGVATAIVVTYSSGSVNPGAYGLYYIYADDPYAKGGAVTYQATLNSLDLYQRRGRLYFGSITTAAGGGGTGGVGGTGCVVAGTPIVLADDSTKPVEQLLPGDMLKTPWGSAPLGSMTEVTTEQIYKLSFSAGPDLVCSATHLLKVNGLWQAVGDLWMEDPKNLSVWTPAASPVFIVARVEQPSQTVYKLHMPEQHVYLAGGVWAHNRKTSEF